MVGARGCPTVSVIISTYNRAHLLGRAIQSVLDQTYQDLEIIVVDDASTDNTEEIVSGFKDERIQYVRHEENKGGAAARNTGIKIANGDYVGLLDDDDEWLGDKLQKQVDAMEELPDNDWGGTYCGHFHMGHKVTRVEAIKQGNLKKELLKGEVNVGASSTLLFRRHAICEVGLFDEDLARYQDWELLIRFFRRYKLSSVREPLVKVYGHNMPSAEKLAEVKNEFLHKVEEDIYQCGKDEAMEIFARHWLEIHMFFTMEGKPKESLHYLKKSLRYKILPLSSYWALRGLYFQLFKGLPASFVRKLRFGRPD